MPSSRDETVTGPSGLPTRLSGNVPISSAAIACSPPPPAWPDKTRTPAWHCGNFVERNPMSRWPGLQTSCRCSSPPTASTIWKASAAQVWSSPHSFQVRPAMSRLNSQHCRSPLSQNHRLLSHCLARTAKLRREVLQLRQAVTHGHYRLGVIDVNTGDKGECRECRGVHVDNAKRRIVGHQVPAAPRAIFALAHRRLGKRREVFCTRCDPDSLPPPE